MAQHGEASLAHSTSEASHDDGSRTLLAARIISIIAVGAASLRFAWLSDDALITARSVLNLLHGYGPVFNIDERVMSYTHPLWFGLQALLGGVTGDVILAPVLLGVCLTVVAWFVVATSITSLARLALATLALLLSNAFVEYSSSGLENPLAYALLAGAVVTIGPAVQAAPGTRPYLGAVLLGLLIAGILLTRLDLALLVLPPLALLAWYWRRQPRIIVTCAITMALPLFVWMLLALAYYGEVLPSTFPAKTNVDIPRTELLFTGFNYLMVTFRYDPVSLVILACAAACAIVMSDRVLRAWMIGAAAYVAYIVWVGGDFMAGRFLAVPVFVAVAALATAPPGCYRRLLPRQASPSAPLVAVLGGCAILVAIGIGRSIVLTPDLPDWPRWDYGLAGGVADERGFYLAKARGLIQYMGAPRPRSTEFLDVRAVPEDWRPDIAQLRAHADAWDPGVETGSIEVTCGGLGELAISTGPSVHWIDPCGLADRFLAGIPYRSEGFAWRIGHFDRPLPEGYLQAVESGDPALVKDPVLRWDLERLWERIRQ
jgi:arabinofuranosyltransferase